MNDDLLSAAEGAKLSYLVETRVTEAFTHTLREFSVQADGPQIRLAVLAMMFRYAVGHALSMGAPVADLRLSLESEWQLHQKKKTATTKKKPSVRVP
jgi:hypothetical protein